MNARITLTVDGDITDQVEVNVTHDVAPNSRYCYGGCRFEDVPVIAEAALEEIVQEIHHLAGLDPAERTQEEAHKIWLEGQRRTDVLGALRSLLAAHRTGSDADIARATMTATEALAAYDKQGDAQNGG